MILNNGLTNNYNRDVHYLALLVQLFMIDKILADLLK